MKKLFALILVIILVIPAAVFSEIPDISGLSEEELLELNHQIQFRLFSQKLIEGVTVPPGRYVVGEDIPAGTYRIEVVFLESGGNFYVYESEAKESNSFGYITHSYLGTYWATEEIGKVELHENNIVIINGNTMKFFPYMGLFN